MAVQQKATADALDKALGWQRQMNASIIVQLTSAQGKESPVVDEVASQYHGKLKVMKMDVDANTATPMRYGIRGIPALLLFKGGKVAEQIVGYVPKDTIDKSVIKVLA